jgi:tripartite-type tricarboxylate transporter receptor subunit TctC
VDASGFQGVLAPAGTPPEAVAKLSQALNAALAQPDLKEKFAAAGLETVSSTPAEFAAFIRSEIAKWAKVAKEANIKVDQ